MTREGTREPIKTGVFTLSLDVELLWGFTPSVPTSDKYIGRLTGDTEGGRGAIDFLVSTFEKYDIPATWAMVGHLFLDHCEKVDGVAHQDMARFSDDWYDRDPCTSLARDPWFYGKDIVEKVVSSPVKHEIGYHSFSHVPFSECSREVAEAEVKEGIEAARELGIALKSFVFPYNWVGHVDVLRDNGFEIYRSDHAIPWSPRQSRLVRTIAAALNLLLAPPVEPEYRDGIWEIPSSNVFLGLVLPFLLLPRTKMGVYWAIRSRKVLHIYLHPHDLVARPSLCRSLDRLLAFVARKRDAGKLQVMTMGQLASLFNDRGMATKG